MADVHLNRRGFVGASAAAGTAALIAPKRASAVLGANDKIRIAIIGSGSRGNQVLGEFLKRSDVEFVAVCDVDDRHATGTAERINKAKGNSPKTDRDYRKFLDDKDVDAVLIATPDHWHAIPTIHACQAGKDVYVEKPLAHNVAEGRAMIEASRKYKRVIAVGTQQRSSENFQKAVETVQSGKIGRVFWIQTWNFENISPLGMGRPADGEAPPHVDYDRWLGPAPKVAFNPARFHLLFRWFLDYAGGMMSDWGVHLNDIALWSLNAKGPKNVSCAGGIMTTDDIRDTADTMQVVYEFDKCLLTYSMRKGNGLPMNNRGYGILFCGTDGSVLLDRSGHEIIPDKIDEPYGIREALGRLPHRSISLKGSKFKAKDDGLPSHVENFVECLRSRNRPIADVEIIHHSTNTCHLGNIALRLGRRLTWDVETETFPNDAEANKYLTREYRQGYELPKV